MTTLYDIVGFDTGKARVDCLGKAETCVDDITDGDLATALTTGRYLPADDPTTLAGFDGLSSEPCRCRSLRRPSLPNYSKILFAISTLDNPTKLAQLGQRNAVAHHWPMVTLS